MPTTRKLQKGGVFKARGEITEEQIEKLLNKTEPELYEYYYKAEKLNGMKMFPDFVNVLDGTYEKYDEVIRESSNKAVHSDWVFYVNDLVGRLRKYKPKSGISRQKARRYATLLEKINGVSFFDLFTLRFFPTSLNPFGDKDKEVHVVKKDFRMTTNPIALTMDEEYQENYLDEESKKRGPKGDMTVEIIESYPDGTFVKWLKDIYGVENMFYLMNSSLKNKTGMLKDINKNRVVKTINTTTLVPSYHNNPNNNGKKRKRGKTKKNK